jgi:hypothetical protein
MKKSGRLADEKSIFRESLQSGHCTSILPRGRSDHRTARQILADEIAGLSQDLVSLGELFGRIVEIRESEPGYRIGHASQRRVHRITRLIMPEPEVINFDSANTHQDPQHCRVGCLEGQRRIEARPTLLNKRKVKSRRVGDRLYALGITACDGNCRIG